MKDGILVNLNDREKSWIYPMKVMAADGRLVEESSTIVLVTGRTACFVSPMP